MASYNIPNSLYIEVDSGDRTRSVSQLRGLLSSSHMPIKSFENSKSMVGKTPALNCRTPITDDFERSYRGTSLISRWHELVLSGCFLVMPLSLSVSRRVQ